MIDTSEVSVIVPVFGPPEEFGEAIESVLRQSPGEIIVVDDCSPRPIPEFESASTRIVYHRLPHNSGPSVARNVGIKLSRRPWIAFIDSDDVWVEGRLRLQLDRLEEARGRYAYGRFLHVDQDGGPDPQGRPPTFVPVVGVLTIERSLMLENLFEESLRYGEDIDLFIRLRSSGAKGLLHEEVVLHYRYRPDSMVSTRPPTSRRNEMVNLIKLQAIRRRKARQ